MTAGDDASQVVVVHGRGSADLEAALELAGMRPAVVLPAVTVWTSTGGPSTSPSPVAPAPAGDAGPERLLLTVAQAAAVLGVGRTMAYQLIRDGELEVVHVGRSSRIPAGSLPETVARLRSAKVLRPGHTTRPAGRIRSVGSSGGSQPAAARTA